MSKYEFMKQVERIIKTSDEATGCMIDSNTYIRNNDVKRYGISISREHEQISPTFYVDRYYDDYQRKKITIEETAYEILSQMKNIRSRNIDGSRLSLSFADFESSITYRLISAEKNTELLENTPHVPFLDLAVIFTIVFENSETGLETIRITDQIQDMWAVSTEDLMKLASINTPRILPVYTQSLASVLGKFLYHGMEEPCITNPAIHILSNKQGVYGATSLVYPGMTEVLAGEVGGSYYVLPSSIHEVLIVPAYEDNDRDMLDPMITQINEEHVKVEEVLSDRAYFYDAVKKQFEF